MIFYIKLYICQTYRFCEDLYFTCFKKRKVIPSSPVKINIKRINHVIELCTIDEDRSMHECGLEIHRQLSFYYTLESIVTFINSDFWNLKSVDVKTSIILIKTVLRKRYDFLDDNLHLSPIHKTDSWYSRRQPNLICMSRVRDYVCHYRYLVQFIENQVTMLGYKDMNKRHVTYNNVESILVEI